MAPSGAALPKVARGVKPGQPQCRMECEVCGIDGAFIVCASRSRVRVLCGELDQGGRALTCPDCGARVLPSNVDDCEELAPHLLRRHPVFIEDEEREGSRELARVKRETAPAGECVACGAPRPDHVDQGEWYCRHCRRVNDSRPDGSTGAFAAPNPFGPEVERCNGLARQVRRGSRRPGSPEGSRRAPRDYTAPADDGIPF